MYLFNYAVKIQLREMPKVIQSIKTVNYLMRSNEIWRISILALVTGQSENK